MVVAGRCYERSTRSFRPDARRLARGLRAPSAHGSRLLRTAPVSERRCNPRGPSLHAHNVGSPDAHDVIKGGAAPIGGRRPFPVSMMVRALVGRASRHWHSARCTWRLARSSLTKASESGCSVDVSRARWLPWRVRCPRNIVLTRTDPARVWRL